MSSPFLKFNNLIINGASLASDYTSDFFDVSEVNSVCVQVTHTGNALGELYFFPSIDGVNVPKVGAVGVTSCTITGAVPVVVGDINPINYKYLCFFYKRSSGTGTLTVQLSGKTLPLIY